VKHVQGHKVKHSNRNNSAADCSISLKFSTEFHQVTCDTLRMFKVKGQSKVKVTESKSNITYQQ